MLIKLWLKKFTNYFCREMYRKTVTEMKDAVNDLRKKLEEFKDLKTYPFDAKYKDFVDNVASGMLVRNIYW